MLYTQSSRRKVILPVQGQIMLHVQPGRKKGYMGYTKISYAVHTTK